MNNINPAVDKAVLLLLALAEKEATQAELCSSLGIAPSTAFRILTTLLSHRWIRKKAGGVYALGDGLLALNQGLSADVSLLEKLSVRITAISAEHQMACKLSVRKENHQLTYFRAEPPGPVALTGQPGSTFPLIEGSVGAALLADEPDDVLKALVQACDEDIPEKRQPELLFDAVREVRDSGAFLNIRKNRWKIAALSMPVRNPMGGVVAALTAIGAASDFQGAKRRRWELILQKAIEECTNSH